MLEHFKEKRNRIAWGITGAGYFLQECVDIIKKQCDIDIFLSRAAQEVLASYQLLEVLDTPGHRVFRDSSASAYAVTKLYKEYYSAVVIAPVTSNSIAKMAMGISDTLVTNLFAHAGKCRVPLFVLPCDWETEVTSSTPKGDFVQVYPRSIDLENIERLASWPGVTVVGTPLELLDHLAY